jgi:hypothetical protein
MVNDFFLAELENGRSLTDAENIDFLHWCELIVIKNNKEYDATLLALDNSDY